MQTEKLQPGPRRSAELSSDSPIVWAECKEQRRARGNGDLQEIRSQPGDPRHDAVSIARLRSIESIGDPYAVKDGN
jgi:hypothetical protein